MSAAVNPHEEAHRARRVLALYSAYERLQDVLEVVAFPPLSEWTESERLDLARLARITAPSQQTWDALVAHVAEEARRYAEHAAYLSGQKKVERAAPTSDPFAAIARRVR